MIKYYYSVNSNNNIYSCDMIRINFELRSDTAQFVYNHFDDCTRIDIKSYSPCFTSWKYKFLFTITSGNSTVSLGIGFNGANSDDRYKGFIEFNPNKIDVDSFYKELMFVRKNCISFCVARFDLAIDIPVARSNFILFKDKRTYQRVENSSDDLTEYLGQRNNYGFVKLYNKSLELEKKHKIVIEPMTRLEITLSDYPEEEIVKQIPKLSYIDLTKLETDKLSKTQEVLLLSMVDSGKIDFYMKMLGPGTTQTKMKKAVENCLVNFDFDMFAFLDIKTKIFDLVCPF